MKKLLAQTDLNLGNITSNYGYSASAANPGDKIAEVVSNILGFLTVIAGVAFVFYFTLGAINLITASGDPQKIKTANQYMLNAIIGIIVTAIAYPLIYVLGTLLGVPFTDPLLLINQIIF